MSPSLSIYARVFKRLCDLAGAVALLALLAPLMFITWLAVRLLLGSPVLFRDERAGLRGEPFRIMKFRSMTTATDADGSLLPDGERLGPFGKFLRRTSLDELPQLLNILAGDMSVVGPRPLPVRYTSRYDARQAMRLFVRPGLTGWAQIHGRNAVDWPERLDYDAQYVERMSRWTAPFTDCWIVVVTIGQVVWQAVTGRGVAAPGSATMQEFRP